MQRLFADDRGVSESAGVAALVAVTVVVTASVGLGVLLVDTGTEEGLDASVSFDYISSRAALLVTYENGSQLPAIDVEFRGPETTATWAAVGGLNDTATVRPGDRVQLFRQNAWGTRVSGDENISVVYVGGENESVLDTWTGS